MANHPFVWKNSTQSAAARWFNRVTALLIVALSVVLILLIVENRRYKGMLAGAGAAGSVDPLEPGERIGEIAITTLEGGEGKLSFAAANNRFLLFVLSTTCPHCIANLPKWAEISRRVAPSGMSVVGLSMEGRAETSDFVKENGVSFYTVTTSDSAFLERYRIPGVPATLLLSTGGIVQGVWMGELDEGQVSEVIDEAL